MIPRLQIVALAVIAGVCSSQAKGGPGYLAMIGPAPLRHARKVEPSVIEPLPEPAKVVASKTIPSSANSETSGPPSLETMVKGSPKADEIQPISSASAVVPAQEPAAVSPYQLLQYLLKPGSTNAVQSVVVLPPINFAPPVQTGPAPSSTATYQKGP